VINVSKKWKISSFLFKLIFDHQKTTAYVYSRSRRKFLYSYFSKINEKLYFLCVLYTDNIYKKALNYYLPQYEK